MPHRLHLYALFIVLLSGIFCATDAGASTVEIRGRITLLSGSLPATAVLHSTAEESYAASTVIARDSTFTFRVEVPRAGMFNIRILRSSFDIMLSTAEPVAHISITFDGEALKEYHIGDSRENDAYRAFKTLIDVYDTKLMYHFKGCVKEDSCEKALHSMLTEYAHELSIIQGNFKGTYTADVLCQMKTPTIAKNEKNTAAEFRKGYFENVNFSDSTIFATAVYREMITDYVEYFIDPSLSKQEQFLKYFTDKIKANPAVLHKSAGLLYDELYRAQKEKMLSIFLAWYNTGDNKTAVNNSVMDMRAQSINAVMPGQPFIDVTGRNIDDSLRSLHDVVSRSRCTLLLFWSSECSHCRDEMPFIQEYYQKYHAQGFDIFAVSIEPDSVKWKSFVRTKELPWANVITDRLANSNQISKYMISSTPTMVLIDSHGIILHRFTPKNRVEEYIKEGLK